MPYESLQQKALFLLFFFFHVGNHCNIKIGRIVVLIIFSAKHTYVVVLERIFRAGCVHYFFISFGSSNCSKKKRASCSDKLTFLNWLFLNARTFICWLANFFVLFFLEDARILIFFLCSYCAALVFEIFDFFSFIFFSQ